MYISDEDEFANDPHQIIPIEDAFALPYLPRQNLEGFDHGYVLSAEVSGFRGTYYHESGDVRPGYTGALGLSFGSSRACGLKTPLQCSSLFFIHCTGIDWNSLSTTRGSKR